MPAAGARKETIHNPPINKIPFWDSLRSSQLKRQLEQNQNVNPSLNLDDEREKIKRELEEKFRKDLIERQAQWESEQKKAEEVLNNGRVDEGDEDCPYLVNLNEDAALSGVLIYR